MEELSSAFLRTVVSNNCCPLEAPHAFYSFQQEFPNHNTKPHLTMLVCPAGLFGKVPTSESELSGKKNDTSADKPASFLLSENEKNVFSSTFPFLS